MIIHPDLGALLRGELANAVAREAVTHSRTCRSCQEDLLDLALGHGLLSAAARTLGGDPRPAAAASGSALLAAPDRMPRRPWRGRRVAVAMAAVLALGAGAGSIALVQDQPGPGRAVTAEKTARLEPVDPGTSGPSGQVSMATVSDLVTRMRVDTADLPRPPRGGFYYVWLLDPASNKMLPLGQLVPGHRATFDVAASLVAAYSAIDVSLEADDDDPGHSVTSVLRASYGAPGPSPATSTG